MRPRRGGGSPAGKQCQMAGLPASPPFANPAANAIAQFNTPAVVAEAVTSTTVSTEASRKRKIYQALDNGLTSGGIPLVTPAEAGLADLRHANSIGLAYGLDVAPPWFAGAMGPIEAHLANSTITRANRRVSNSLSKSTRVLPQTHERNEFLIRITFLQAYSNEGCNILRPICKTAPGFGAAPVHVQAAVAAVFAAPTPLPGALTFPPAALRFPQTTTIVLTVAEIGNLSRWYNSTFGIAAGDAHGVQLQKLKDFLSGFV
jgi:hypothetical protein